MRQFNKKYWPHQHRFGRNNEKTIPYPEEIERWCYDNFKSSEWRNDRFYFAFKRETDFTFFMLRWA